MPSFPARVEPVRDTHFGRTIDDPYRWMEYESAERDAWLADQAAAAHERLAGSPDRAELVARVRALRGEAPQWSSFAVAGDRVFCLRQEPGAAVAVLVMREEGEAADRVLLDPSLLAGPAHTTLGWHVPAPDGRSVACALASGGSESHTVRVVDDRGRLREDAVTGVRYPFLSWFGSDGQSFLYHRYPEPPAGAAPDQRRMDSRTLLHRLGEDPAHDRVVLARGVNPRVPMSPLDRPFLYHRAGSDWLVAIISHSAVRGDRTQEAFTDCSLYVAPAAGVADPGSCPWVRVAGPADAVTAFEIGDEELYLVSHREAPRGQVLAVRLAEPSLAEATGLLPESERVIEAVRLAGNQLLVRELEAGVARLRRIPLAGGAPQEIALPVDGAIVEWAGGGDQETVLLQMESWTSAPRVDRCHAGTGAVTETSWASPTPTGFAEVESYQLHAPARDGTPIPLSVVHRRGIDRDSDNPTLLEGYGSYGIPLVPMFVPGMLAWLERGGIWAIAHVRGGGEYGHAWHRAGRLLRKETTITDFIDCAVHLVAQRYTRPQRLAGRGGSAGGIPTGGALTRRPDLWAAMVMEVAVTNLLRNEFSENGPVNVPEFGTVATEDGLRSLLIADSYHRVEDGTPYPAVLLTTGRNDPRVAIWQPGKMAARLQAATSSGQPVLLRVEEHGGHGFGATAEQTDDLLADILGFLLDHLRA